MPQVQRGPSGHRILALVTDAFGGYGGMAQYNRDLIAAVAVARGVHGVDVLPRQAADSIDALPPNVSQAAPAPGRSRYVMAALRAMRGAAPTVVFCGHVHHGPLALAVARMSRAPLVSQVHGKEIWGTLRRTHREALERSDLVLTVSRDTRARVLALTDAEPDNVVVLNNTVGEEFTPGDRNGARARLGIGAGCVVLTVARLDAREGYKGHDLVIAEVARLRGAGVELRYLVCGIGTDRSRLERLATAHGVHEHVQFLGKVPASDLPYLYRAADVFALPSTGEGFGIAFLEAIACGTPAIGLSVGGARDALADGELGSCTSIAEFPASFERLVRGPRPDGTRLAGMARARFGAPQFRARASQLFARVTAERTCA